MKKVLMLESRSWKETFDIACRLARDAKPGQIYALDGDLGVGKTVFTKGFAYGLGITEPVSSPTFLIVQIYDSGRLPLYHFDVCRISDPEEMDEIGYEDCFFGQGVCLIEWADMIRDLLPGDCIHIHISKDLAEGFDYRKIRLEYPESGEEICGS